MTMKKMAKHLLCIGILAALAFPAFAETRTISWSAVATYTDGTPIEAGKTVSYSVYWTTDPGLGSLHTIRTGIATTSTTFDPGTQEMPAGGTVYFTVKTVLSSSEISALSPGYAWIVPSATPPPAVLSSISVSGPSSVNEGGTGTYTATATWSDSTTTPVTPTWSENSSYATISSGGVLTASTVTSNQSVTVTASYGGKTGTKSVTIANVAATLSSISVSGPSSVNEGGTGTYTATATWSDSTTTPVTPTWSENSSYATISSGGVLTASTVTSNQSVTVTASYGGKTGTKNVTIANVTATLSGLAVSGPSSVDEGGTGTYAATATWSNSTTSSVTPTWSENSSYATISSGGVLTASTVTSNQSVTVTASYTSGGVTKTATRAVTIANVTATVGSLSVSGPSAVNEGGTGTYAAAATWSDSTTTSVTPTWSVSPATYATISSGGVLTASTVTSNQAVTVTATYGGKAGTKSVSIVIVPAGLSSVAVSGPSSVNEGGTGTYMATGTWDNGTTLEVTPTWSVSTSYATISAGGVLTASAVTSNQTATVTASYGGKTGTKSVIIADVIGSVPAAPKDIGIRGPTLSGTTEIWQLHWEPVTTNWDGTPIDAGRTVRYTVYWTDDPALSEGSLRELASLIYATTLDFDPSGNQMVKNRVVYLTVQAILDTGEPSLLAPGLTWRVENLGPVPPGRGKIYKK